MKHESGLVLSTVGMREAAEPCSMQVSLPPIIEEALCPFGTPSILSGWPPVRKMAKVRQRSWHSCCPRTSVSFVTHVLNLAEGLSWWIDWAAHYRCLRLIRPHSFGVKRCESDQNLFCVFITFLLVNFCPACILPPLQPALLPACVLDHCNGPSCQREESNNKTMASTLTGYCLARVGGQFTN